MRNTCFYHRSRASTILRDAVTLDDWSGAITEIKEAEPYFNDYDQYISAEASSQRGQIKKKKKRKKEKKKKKKKKKNTAPETRPRHN